MKEDNKSILTPKVAQEADIYSESNLFTKEEEQVARKEFEAWFKVKIQGKVNSYKLHDDGSLQLKFQHIVDKEIQGVSFKDIEDKSIRVRKDVGIFSEKDAKDLLGKVVEIVDVNEMPVYAKKPNGDYDFNRVERYIYSANNVKVIEKSVPSGFELFKIVEFKVKEVIPSIKYDQRQRKQVLDKTNTILIYETIDDTLVSLHKIIVQGLSYNAALELKGKEVMVLDLSIIGKNYYCSKIKLKG